MNITPRKESSIGLFVPIIFAGALLIPNISSAQDEEILEEVKGELKEALQEVEEEIKEIDKEFHAIDISKTLGLKDKNEPRLGLYLDDLDFEEAYEKHYPYCYGVLVSGVVRGGNGDQAGLTKGDIIMEFDGETVRFEDHLIGLRDSKNIGDTVPVKIFRNEKILATSLTFEPPAPEVDEKGKPVKEKKLSVGYGGGYFEPVYIDFDFADLNKYLDLNGFGDLTKGYTLTWGGGGMGNVGKGWFIGGMGAGIENKQQIKVTDGYRKYKFDLFYGGVTITKKYALFSERLVLDIGTMLGGGAIELAMSQTDGTFSWGNEIDEGSNYSVKYNKNFAVARPSVGLLIRIKKWVGVHGSVGYFGSYATDDKWKEDLFDFTVSETSDYPSPELPNGPSYSLGFWFGF